MTFTRILRSTALLLIPAMLGNSFALAASKPLDAATVKARLEARGVGEGVRVTLADNTEAKGMILSIGEQSFALKEKKVDQPRTIEYARITGVHKDKMSAGQKVGVGVIVVGAAIAITAIVIYEKLKNSPFI